MEQMTTAERLFKSIGLENQSDYIWSMQGPTVVLTISGQAKMASVSKSNINTLTRLGIQILGL
jgi:hypothetical protein